MTNNNRAIYMGIGIHVWEIQSIFGNPQVNACFLWSNQYTCICIEREGEREIYTCIYMGMCVVINILCVVEVNMIHKMRMCIMILSLHSHNYYCFMTLVQVARPICISGPVLLFAHASASASCFNLVLLLY